MPCAPLLAMTAAEGAAASTASPAGYAALLFGFLLATFIGLGVVKRVSRLLHTGRANVPGYDHEGHW